MIKQKCQFCNKGVASIPITDCETLQEVWICEKCDYDIEFNYWLQEIKETDNYIIKKSVLTQKKRNRKAVGERK